MFGQWQPIATAPKDGTDIIVCVWIATVPIVNSGYYDDGELFSGTGFNSKEALEGWWAWRSSVGSEKLDDIMTPTHWMPLPKPPHIPYVGNMLIAAVARAIRRGIMGDTTPPFIDGEAVVSRRALDLHTTASEVLSAIEAAGFKIVPTEGTDD
jgi:hypothetical protein